MKNQYEKLFDELLEYMEFSLAKYANGFGVIDLQNENIANIEGDRFLNATELFKRMHRYIEDYIINPLLEAICERGKILDYNANLGDIIQVGTNILPKEYRWNLEVLKAIFEHSQDINLNNCMHEFRA